MKLTASVLLLLGPACAFAADSINRETTSLCDTINATVLYENAQQRLKAGKYGTASVTFRTLISVYPESPLATQAAEGLRMAEEMEAQSGGPVIRSLRFEHVQPLRRQDVLERFEEREAGLGVERHYDLKAVEEAKTILAELLAERGVTKAKVRVHAREIAPHGVEVTLRVGKR